MCDKNCESCRHTYEPFSPILKNCGTCKRAIKEYKNKYFSYQTHSNRLVICNVSTGITAFEETESSFASNINFRPAEGWCDAWEPCDT